MALTRDPSRYNPQTAKSPEERETMRDAVRMLNDNKTKAEILLATGLDNTQYERCHAWWRIYGGEHERNPRGSLKARERRRLTAEELGEPPKREDPRIAALWRKWGY